MNAVTCLQWIGRGLAKRQPDQIKIQESELKNLIETVKGASLSDSDSEDGSSDFEHRRRKLPGNKGAGTKPKDEIDTVEEEEDTEGDKLEDDSEANNPLSFRGIAYYGGDAKDPNLIEGPDSDDEDMEILPDDNLIAIGKVKKDFCTLEVYVHNETVNNCWCHHEIILPTIPLCMEWLDFDIGESNPGNLVAVGNVGPDIEVWDLDVVNSLEPAYILAGVEKRAGKKKKKKSVAGHSDAVLALSWNKPYRHALASGSADCSAGLWDLSEGKLVTSIKHSNKVQAVQWQPSNPQSLLTGCADKTVNLYDCRSLDPSKTSWSVEGEVEQVLWNSFDPNYFYVGTDAGFIYYFDSRTDKKVFQLKAHSEAVSSVAQSAQIPGCLVTSGSDKVIHVWDVKESVPKQVFSKKLNMGQLFSVSGCPDSALLFAVAGEQEFRVLDLAKNPTITQHFGLSVGDSTVMKSGDIEVPIGYDDESNDSDISTDDEKVNVHVPEVESKSKRKRKKKKAARKLTADSVQQHSATAYSEASLNEKAKPNVTNSVGTKLPSDYNSNDSEIDSGDDILSVKEPGAFSKSKKNRKKQKARSSTTDVKESNEGLNPSSECNAKLTQSDNSGNSAGVKSKIDNTSHPAARRKKYRDKKKKPAGDSTEKHIRF